MIDMGMTDKQFNGFLRFLLDSLEEVKNEPDPKARDKKFQKIIDNIQKIIED